jgi:hypothetical protein
LGSTRNIAATSAGVRSLSPSSVAFFTNILQSVAGRTRRDIRANCRRTSRGGNIDNRD